MKFELVYLLIATVQERFEVPDKKGVWLLFVTIKTEGIQ